MGYIVGLLFGLKMSNELVLKIIKNDAEDDNMVDEKALKDFDQYLHHFRLSKHNKEKKIMDIQNNVSGIRRIHTQDETTRYYDSDSPITMDSSDDGGSDFDGGHENIFLDENSSSKKCIESEKKKHKKLSYEKVKNSLDSLNHSDKYSSDIDILITFLKGQTHLYSLSKSLTQQKINWLTIPSFLFFYCYHDSFAFYS